MARPRASIADKLIAASDRLAAGLRETPQRFFPLAIAACRDDTVREKLVRHLLQTALSDAEADMSCPADVRDLLRNVAAAPDIRAFGADILALTPRQRYRRNRHSHSEVARHRYLLMLRAMLWDAEAARKEAWFLTWAVAYAVSDYNADHFVFIGPEPERRLRRLAAFVASELGYARHASAR